MRRYLTLAGLIVLSLRAQPAVQFVAANSVGCGAVTARITGTAERSGDVLKIAIKTCSLFRPERFSDPIHLVSIVSGISRTIPGNSWEILRRSERLLLPQSLAPGKKIDLPPFELAIPIEEFTIEDRDRLTFEISIATEIDGQKHGGFVPVHARIQWPLHFSSKNAEGASSERFRAYSDVAAYPIEGEIDGRVSRLPGALTISVDTCLLSSSPEYPDEGRQIRSIQVLIARTLEYGKMTIERTGDSQVVTQALKPGGAIALLPFALQLPLTNYSKYPTDWISLLIISVASDGSEEETYLHVPYQLPVGQ